MAKKTTPYQAAGMVSLVATFVLMCVAQLWYTMFLLFLFALAIVLLQGKNSYCANLCPLGTLQDAMGEKASRARHFRGVTWLKYLLIPLFWAAVIYTTWLYHDKGVLIWVWMLRIMVSMFFLAILAQELFGKRFFCVHLCPLRHPVLDPARKLRNCAVRGCPARKSESP